MPQLRRALPHSRTNLDPPDSPLKASVPSISSNGVPPVNLSSGIVPDSVSSCLVPLPDSATSGQSSVRQAVINTSSSIPTASASGHTPSEFEDLDRTIESFSRDMEDWKEMGLLDDHDMVDAKESKKRDRSYAVEINESGVRDSGELLAPFPMVPNPLEFVQQHLGHNELQGISAAPEEDRQYWLVEYLKNVLLKFPEEHQRTILKAPKDEHFFVMKKLYDELGLGKSNASGHEGAGSG